MQEEWWSEGLKDDVRIQWKVDRTRGEVVAIRMSYTHQKLNAVLCISLDYDKIFQPLTNILTDENGGIVADKDGNVLYNKTGLKELKLSDDNKIIKPQAIISGISSRRSLRTDPEIAS